MVADEVENSTARQSYTNIPKHIRMEVGKYALAHSTEDALAKFSKQHPKYMSIDSWKASFEKNGESQNLNKIGRPNLLSEELLKRTKDLYYCFTSCRHSHFKDCNRHRNRSRKSR